MYIDFFSLESVANLRNNVLLDNHYFKRILVICILQLFNGVAYL